MSGPKLLLVSLLLCLCSCSFGQSSEVDLSKPFLFTYGTWDKNAAMGGGKVSLGGTATPRGGAGINENLDLASFADYTPVITVNVLPGNKLTGFRLILLDSGEKQAVFHFVLPSSSGPVELTANEGASLSAANELPKGPIKLSEVRQWQLAGNWLNDEPAKIEITRIRFIRPTSAILNSRKQMTDRLKAEKTAKEQENLSLRERFGKRSSLSPKLVQAYFLGPTWIALEVQSGNIQKPGLIRYEKQPGDIVRDDNRSKILSRNGKDVGNLIGPNRDWLQNWEIYSGDPILDEFANDPAQFFITSNEDPAYKDKVSVRSVARKTKPIDAAMPSYEMVLRHRFYLQLPKPLTLGKSYVVNVGKLNLQQETISVTYKPESVWSEAVKVNQLGFRPSDPVKRGFVSLWLGTGGALKLEPNPKFQVVEVATGKTVYRGAVELALAEDQTEKLRRSENFSKTNVYRMDFADVKTPGDYKLVVEGVGSSYPFKIGDSTWERAFKVQMRGLLNNRTGMELGPPYTTFKKPLDLHPKAGTRTTRSAYNAMDGGGENKLLANMDTGERVDNAWGGYHDAGDWNPRRATHLKVTNAHLELMEMFPVYFTKLKWNIPQDIKGGPDTLSEALWKISVWRRLQLPNGGIPYGIETDGDPISGEVSWLQSMQQYVYAPDIWSSWMYAGTASRFAELVKPFDAKLSADYSESAAKAFAWAEVEYPKRKAAKKPIEWWAINERNASALLLYRASKKKEYWNVFMQDTVLKNEKPNLFDYGTHWQTNAAFILARMPEELVTKELKIKAIAAIDGLAKASYEYSQGNAWNFASSDQSRPLWLGFYSSPNGMELARAHYLTKNPDYLKGLVQSTLFCGGANPSQVTYTSGLGTKSVMPFKIDYRNTNQPVPEGLTVYGNCDFIEQRENNFFTWPIQWHVSRVAIPDVYTWPMHEALFETYLYPAQLEYTVDAWEPNVYVWGYLAART